MLCSYVFSSCAGQRGLGTGVGVPAPEVVPAPPGGQMSQAGPSLRQASCAGEDCAWRCLGAPDAWGAGGWGAWIAAPCHQPCLEARTPGPRAGSDLAESRALASLQHPSSPGQPARNQAGRTNGVQFCFKDESS